MNYRVNIDEFSRYFDLQLINAQHCGKMDEYRADLAAMNKKIAETLWKTYELEQNSPAMQVAPTQHPSLKRDRKVATNTSVPMIQSQSNECPMPSKRAKERVIISKTIFLPRI